MSQCLNPECLRQNPPTTIFCQHCGSKMVLGDRYRAVGFIGASGFGRTFQAVDEHRLDTICVIKQFLPQQSGSKFLARATELFKQEAVRLRDLGKHSQIPDLLAFFQQEGRLYLIQEFIPGENLLHELNRKGKFSEIEVKNILIDLLPVLQFIHDNKVIHRDIKPENIIRSSQTDNLFLIDFGVSKEISGTLMSELGTIAGTPGYAPPEQFRGIVFPNSGLYSLAVTCIRLLTGHLQKGNGVDLLFDSMKMQWIWKNHVCVSKDLEIVLDKMLCDLPMNRFQSASEVLLALQPSQITQQSIPPIPIKNNPSALQQILKFITPKPPKPNVEISQVTSGLKNISLTENLGNGVMLEMISVPGGTFIMGSSENEIGHANNETPQHQVSIQPFSMGKYPVTQVQWERVAFLPKVKIDLNPKPSVFVGANLPVESVSWFDVQEFCARLSKLTGKRYRLPSEAEWEYACRGKTTTVYHFGNTINGDVFNHNRKYAQTTEVGKFPPNGFGLHDMHGNVWEWCKDSWHTNYINAPNNGSAWINLKIKYRVLRGGAWNVNSRCCRCAYRYSSIPDIKLDNTGFRLIFADGKIN